VSTSAFALTDDAVQKINNANRFMSALIGSMKCCRRTMAASAERNHVSATVAAEQLVINDGLSFRQAHHRIGSAIRASKETDLLPSPFEALGEMKYGGGPGHQVQPERDLRKVLTEACVFLRDQNRRRVRARNALHESVRRIGIQPWQRMSDG
jgi:argininosuccinate lyase